MKPIRTLGLAALALALGVAFATPAEARDHRRGHDRGHSERDWRHDRHARADHRRDHRRGDRKHDRRYDRRDTRVVYVPRPVVVHHPSAYRGPPPWARGRHYRHTGYGPTYVVREYRPYGLRQPPRGYHWRRSDAGDFLLVAVATGIIADVILNR